MTLSPAGPNDFHARLSDVVRCETGHTFKCPMIGIYTKKTRLHQIERMCLREGNIPILFCAKDQTNINLNGVHLSLDGVVVVFKYAVVLIKRIALSMFDLIIFGTTREVYFQVEETHTNRKTGTYIHFNSKCSVCIREKRTFKNMCLKISCDRVQHFHHPYCDNLADAAAECVEPGLDLFYGCLSKDKYIPLLQDSKDHKIYCVHPSCKQYFVSLDAWRKHYTVGFALPGKFTMARFRSNGQITPNRYANIKQYIPPRKDASKNKYIPVLPRIRPLVWGSLCDPTHGKNMHIYLSKKLKRLATY